jgi:hypothetical protein
MEINSIERKLTGMIEDVQRKVSELPSHKQINLYENDSSKRIQELSLIVEQL